MYFAITVLDLGAVPSTSSLRSCELRLAGQPEWMDCQMEIVRAKAARSSFSEGGLFKSVLLYDLGGETAFDMR